MALHWRKVFLHGAYYRIVSPLSQDNVDPGVSSGLSTPSWIDFGNVSSESIQISRAVNFLFRNCLILFKFPIFSNLSSTVDLIVYVH